MIIVAGTATVPSVDEASEVVLPELPPRPSSAIVFTGSDGSSWDLINGPVRLAPGVVGFLPGDIQRRWSESPMVDGALNRGYQVPVLPITLPVVISAPDGLAMRDIERDLWAGLSPDEVCYLTLTTPDAVSRTIPVWFDGVGNPTLDRDPILMGSIAYPLGFTAADPFWRGEPDDRVFEPVINPPDFYATGSTTDLFVLVSDRTTDTSTISNLGDVAAWPLYAVTGPVGGFTVGVGDSVITYGAVAAGVTVWIDAHPARRTIGFTRGGNDEAAWLNVSARAFAPVPPGAEVEIVTTLLTPADGAEVLVELTPLYRRPW